MGARLAEPAKPDLWSRIAAVLLRGEVVAAAGQPSELESVLPGDPRFAIEPSSVPRLRDGWAAGMAVKKECEDLASALQAAVNQLTENDELAQ